MQMEGHLNPPALCSDTKKNGDRRVAILSSAFWGRTGLKERLHSIRPFVIGRRNWLFADTVAGANASANLYSLLQTCKVNGIDGYRYLLALFVALPHAQTADDYEALLTWRIALPAQ